MSYDLNEKGYWDRHDAIVTYLLDNPRLDDLVRRLDQADSQEPRKTISDAVNNEYQPEYTDEEWTTAALNRLLGR